MPDRARRALASIGVAAVVIVVAAAVYLHSNLAAPARPTAVPSATPRPAPILGSFSFGDADHGAVTLFGLPSGTGPSSSSTWLTSDGGHTWRRFNALTGGYVSLIFDSPRHAAAWTSGGGSMLSDDGGRSWRPLTPPDAASTFLGLPVFLDAEHGWWLQTIGHPFPAEPHPVAVWRTSDGGRAWQRLPALGIPDAGNTGQLLFTGPEHGLLVVTPPGGGAPSLLATADGGAMWQPAATFDSPVPGTLSLSVRLFAHGGRLLAIPVWVAGAQIGPAGFVEIRSETDVAFHSFVSVSDDAGRTWSPLRPGPTVAGASIGVARPTMDERGRLVLLDGRRLWVSGDGGATWQAGAAALPGGLQAFGTITAVPGALFVSARAGSRASPVDLLRSQDGGSHWSAVRLPKPSA